MGLVFSSTQSTGSPSSPPIQDLRVWHRMYRALLLSLELFQKNGKPWVGGLTKLPFKAMEVWWTLTCMSTHCCSKRSHLLRALHKLPQLPDRNMPSSRPWQKSEPTVISEDTPWPWRTGHGAVGSIEVEFLSCHTALCYPVKKQFVDSSCFLSWAWKCPLLEMKWEHPKWWVQCWLHIKLLQFLFIVLKQYHIKIT